MTKPLKGCTEAPKEGKDRLPKTVFYRFFSITFSGYVALHILIAGRRLHMRIQRGDSGLVCWHLQRLENKSVVCAAMTI